MYKFCVCTASTMYIHYYMYIKVYGKQVVAITNCEICVGNSEVAC